MAKVNDYSGFNQVFRDTTIGIALSAGGLSTLLPNMLEALSQTRDLATFDALNFFSVIYFIVPILIFTSYWIVVGHKKYIINKISSSSLEDYYKKSNSTGRKKIVTLLLIAFKILPVFLFVTDGSSLKSAPFILICGYYGLLALVEVSFITRYIYSITLEIPLAEQQKRTLLRAKGFRVNILIFTLDMFIGLALAVFNEPWVIYQGSFYVYFTNIITIYTIIGLSFHWSINKAKGISYDLVIVWLLIVTLGLCVPAVNLQANTIIPFIVFVLTISLMIIIAWPLKTLADYFKIIFPSGIFLLIYVTLTNGFEKVNRSYLENRIEAASQMPNDKLFPFYFYKTEKDISIKEALAKALTIDSLNHRFLKDPNGRDSLEKKYKNEFNVRSIYYGSYDSILKDGTFENKLKKFTQHQIDSFYNGLVHRLEIQLFPTYFGSCKADALMISTYELEEYIHPIDFYAAYLKDERGQRDTMREIVGLLERIKIYRSVIFSLDSAKGQAKQLAKDYNRLEITLHDLVKKIQDIREANLFHLDKITEKSSTRDFVRSDSVRIQSFIQLANQILAVQEGRYEKVYKGGQKIYRSYLVDSQRIGVYTFMTTLIVLALAWYFYSKDEELNTIEESSEAETLGPRQLFFIQTLSVFILLIPLIRPINPENIDPEKPYWMMTLQNWHTPSFTASYSYKKPPSSETSSLTPLIDLLKGVRDDLKGLNKEVDSVSYHIHQLEWYDEPERTLKNKSTK